MARQDDRLTAHLRWRELACSDGTPYPARWTQRAWRLAQVFEAIRAIWDRPIRIGSAYRTAEHNRAIGGSVNSQHVLGLALDLCPPAGVPVEAFWAEVRLRALHDPDPTWQEVGGLGRYPAWGIHVDLRPRVDGRLAEWEG